MVSKLQRMNSGLVNRIMYNKGAVCRIGLSMDNATFQKHYPPPMPSSSSLTSSLAFKVGTLSLDLFHPRDVDHKDQSGHCRVADTTLVSNQTKHQLPVRPVLFGPGVADSTFAERVYGSYSVLVKQNTRATFDWVAPIDSTRAGLPSGVIPSGYDAAGNPTYVCQPNLHYLNDTTALAPAGTLWFPAGASAGDNNSNMTSSGVCATAGNAAAGLFTSYRVMNASWDNSRVTGCASCCGVNGACSDRCTTKNFTLCTIVCKDLCSSKVILNSSIE